MRLVPKRGCSRVYRVSKGQDGRADSQGHHGWEMEGCRPVKIRNPGAFQLIDWCSSLVAELVNGMGSRSDRPILRSEIDAPEMGTGRKKFNTHTHPFFGSIANINHSAFLLFLSHGINQHQVCPQCDLFLKVKQPSVSVDHDRLAVLPEFAPMNALARRAHGYTGENTRAAPLLAAGLFVDLCFAHGCFLSCMARDPESTAPAVESA